MLKLNMEEVKQLAQYIREHPDTKIRINPGRGQGKSQMLEAFREALRKELGNE